MVRSIAERVTSGASHLDENFPGWEDNIHVLDDEPDINLQSSNLHPWALASGMDFNLGIRQHYDDNSEKWLYDLGFATPDDQENDEIEEEWKMQILKRKYAKENNIQVNPQLQDDSIQGELF